MKRHSFDIVSFVFGILFLGVGLSGMFVDEDITFLETRWIWPTLLVAAGLAIVGFTVGKERRDKADDRPYDPVD